jgi:hypothetical protein
VVVMVERQAASVEVTPDGYVVSREGTTAVGRGGVTEADAWRDFWDTMLANWRPPNETTQWWRVRTIRVRDLFG